MKQVTFRQDPVFSNEEFIIEGDSLTMRLRAAGLNTETKIELRQINPEVRRTTRRFLRFSVASAIIPGLVICIFWFLFYQSHTQLFWMLSSIFAIYAMLFAYRGLKPVEIAEFTTDDGDVLFVLYRPRKSFVDYEQFIDLLVKRSNELRHAARQQ